MLQLQWSSCKYIQECQLRNSCQMTRSIIPFSLLPLAQPPHPHLSLSLSLSLSLFLNLLTITWILLCAVYVHVQLIACTNCPSDPLLGSRTNSSLFGQQARVTRTHYNATNCSSNYQTSAKYSICHNMQFTRRQNEHIVVQISQYIYTEHHTHTSYGRIIIIRSNSVRNVDRTINLLCIYILSRKIMIISESRQYTQTRQVHYNKDGHNYYNNGTINERGLREKTELVHTQWPHDWSREPL